MNFRQINTNGSGGSLHIPLRREDGTIARGLDKSGVYRAFMVKPEVFGLLKRPLTATLADNQKEAARILEAAMEAGHAKFSDMPYDVKQEQAVLGVPHGLNLKAANTIQPYDTDWQTLDSVIRGIDRSTDDNEYMFLESLGLVENSLQWSDWQIKNIIRQQLEKRSNGRYAFTDMMPMAEKDPFGKVRFGEAVTEIPINWNTMVTATRAGSMAADAITAEDAAISTQLQRNYDLLFGAGGISLASPGTYWKGLLNNTQTATFDNTLGGLYAPPGKYMNNVDDIQDILNFVKSEFVASAKYGNFAAMFGFDISLVISNTIDDNKSDGVTLATTMANKARDLNDAEFRWGVSHKIPTDSAVFMVTNPRNLQIKSGGPLNLFELQSNGLGRESFIYSMDTIVAPGDGVTGHISIIYITGLLPTP